jgi:hypothetical protein
MNKFFGIALMAVVFASCQNASETDTATETTKTDSVNTAMAPNMVPAPGGAPTMANVPATATAAPVAGAEGLNPAHGAPGHRCDIAVGAPLSTPVTSAAPTPAAISNGVPPGMQAQGQAPAAVQPSAAGGRTNPPHGAPGHDCNVAVGAPLKS